MRIHSITDLFFVFIFSAVAVVDDGAVQQAMVINYVMLANCRVSAAISINEERNFSAD